MALAGAYNNKNASCLQKIPTSSSRGASLDLHNLEVAKEGVPAPSYR